MTEVAGRGAYLSALGIEQWQPRAVSSVSSSETIDVEQPAPPAAPAAATHAVSTELGVPSGPEQTPAEQAPSEQEVPKAASYSVPASNQLQDNHAAEALAAASVSWQVAANSNTSLAVICIDARAEQLQAGSIEQEREILQKMLAAIGIDISHCAIGALGWGVAPSVTLGTPYALILVDSGEDAAAMIHYWQDKLITVQGARAVIAPHPRMFAQGTAIKRQAWNSLQMLQQLWTS